MRPPIFVGLLISFMTTASAAFAQESPISAIPFETIPEAVVLQGGEGILLDGGVAVSQDLVVEGLVESLSGGFAFPDGSVQRTASGLVGGSANAGLYDNRIVLMTPPLPFSEICFRNGAILGDVHVSSESTAGGNCNPGDVGWVVERNERTAANWEDARVACLLEGMRLPETFEWLVSCNNANAFGLNAMTSGWEWGSNGAIPIWVNMTAGPAVLIFGGSSCNSSTFAWAARSTGSAESYSFRCLR